METGSVVPMQFAQMILYRVDGNTFCIAYVLCYIIMYVFYIFLPFTVNKVYQNEREKTKNASARPENAGPNSISQ